MYFPARKNDYVKVEALTSSIQREAKFKIYFANIFCSFFDEGESKKTLKKLSSKACTFYRTGKIGNLFTKCTSFLQKTVFLNVCNIDVLSWQGKALLNLVYIKNK